MSWHKDGEMGFLNVNKHIHLALGVEHTTWDSGEIHWHSIHVPLLCRLSIAKLAEVRVLSVSGAGVKLFGYKDKVSAVCFLQETYRY